MSKVGKVYVITDLYFCRQIYSVIFYITAKIKNAKSINVCPLSNTIKTKF